MSKEEQSVYYYLSIFFLLRSGIHDSHINIKTGGFKTIIKIVWFLGLISQHSHISIDCLIFVNVVFIFLSVLFSVRLFTIS